MGVEFTWLNTQVICKRFRNMWWALIFTLCTIDHIGCMSTYYVHTFWLSISFHSPSSLPWQRTDNTRPRQRKVYWHAICVCRRSTRKRTNLINAVKQSKRIWRWCQSLKVEKLWKQIATTFDKTHERVYFRSIPPSASSLFATAVFWAGNYICLAFLQCAFSNVSSKCLSENSSKQPQLFVGCCVFSAGKPKRKVGIPARVPPCCWSHVSHCVWKPLNCAKLSWYRNFQPSLPCSSLPCPTSLYVAYFSEKAAKKGTARVAPCCWSHVSHCV